MPKITRKIILNYQGEIHIYYRVAKSDAQAAMYAIHALEEKLGKVRGALVSYFKQNNNRIEVFIL